MTPVSVWTSGQWCEYFRANGTALMDIPWEEGVSLTASEREAIGASVAEFQLGESSEGRHLVSCAQNYARSSGDAAYEVALRMFIGEEHRHAADLGRVLDLAGLPRVRKTWPDAVFRWLRRRAGLEVSVSVLITAEVIAQVYYAALREATGSLVLRRLCEQILRDEAEHVRFQAERLAILRRGAGWWRLFACAAAHRFFFGGTCFVVWMKHGRAMRAGGYGFGRFWREGRRAIDAAVRRMNPREYQWSGAADVPGQGVPVAE